MNMASVFSILFDPQYLPILLIGMTIGLVVGFVMALAMALVPLIVGLKKKMTGWAWGGFGAVLGAWFFLGNLFALAACIIFTVLICKKSKKQDEESEETSFVIPD